ncbi:MAG: oligosaccharide flippase family protein [Myxococcota bacterium]
MGGHGASLVLRVGSSAVLTRLLDVEVYGLLELVWVFMTGLQLFSDLGLNVAVVQSEKGDKEDFLNVVWTLNCIRGGVIWVGAALGAIPMALFYETPALAVLLPVAALTAVLDGFNATSLMTQTRRLNQGPLIRLEVSVQVITAIVQIAVAMVWPSPWAIVVGTICGSAFRLFSSFFFFKTFRHRFHFDRQVARELFNFGRWIFLATLVTFISSQGDRMLLGKLMDLSYLGVYAIAGRLSLALESVMKRISSSVIFPMFSEAIREHAKREDARPEELAGLLNRARLRSDLAFMVPAGMLIVLGELVVRIIYDPRYLDAGYVLQIMAIRTALGNIVIPCEAFFLAGGDSRFGFWRSLLQAGAVLIGVPIGYAIGDFWGIVWAIGLSGAPVVIYVWFALIRRGIFRLTIELRSFGFLLVGLGLGYLVDQALRTLFF